MASTSVQYANANPFIGVFGGSTNYQVNDSPVTTYNYSFMSKGYQTIKVENSQIPTYLDQGYVIGKGAINPNMPINTPSNGGVVYTNPPPGTTGYVNDFPVGNNVSGIPQTNSIITYLSNHIGLVVIVVILIILVKK